MGVFDGMSSVFTRYAVTLEFEDKLMGGIPKDPKVIQGWLKSKAGITERAELMAVAARTLEENGNGLGVTPDEIRVMAEEDPDSLYNLFTSVSEDVAGSKQTNGFKVDDNGLYIEDRQVKAMLKESTNILFAGERWGKTKKGPKAFVSERVFVKPKRIYLGTHEPSGIELVVGHVTDKMGKRSTLTYHEYVERPTIQFEVKVVRDELILEQWAQLWEHAGENGLGALRSQSHGRFDIQRWEKVQ